MKNLSIFILKICSNYRQASTNLGFYISTQHHIGIVSVMIVI